MNEKYDMIDKVAGCLAGYTAYWFFSATKIKAHSIICDKPKEFVCQSGLKVIGVCAGIKVGRYCMEEVHRIRTDIASMFAK